MLYAMNMLYSILIILDISLYKILVLVQNCPVWYGKTRKKVKFYKSKNFSFGFLCPCDMALSMYSLLLVYITCYTNNIY